MTPITIAAALKRAEQKLSHVEDAPLVARALLSHVLDCDPTYLFGYANSSLSDHELAIFEQLLSRAKDHEPLAYIVGHKEFFGLDYVVTPEVLIPRPETEQLVEATLHFVAKRRQEAGGRRQEAGRDADTAFSLQPSDAPLRIVDVGTGSGCIAISLSKHLPEAQIYAVDVSGAALEVAKMNAERLGVTNIIFLHGCLLEPLQGLAEAESIDIIVANLPYISDEEFEKLPENVRNYEPELALRTHSPDPESLNKQLVAQAKRWLKRSGLLAYETTNGKIVVKEM